MNLLWKIDFRDGTEQFIPEQVAKQIQAAMQRGDKFINTLTRSFSLGEIRNLERTSRPDVEEAKLLAEGEAALAKNEPIVVEYADGTKGVKALTLRKRVTQKEYATYYSKAGIYKRVASDEAGVTVEYIRPAHLGIPFGSEVAA